MATDKSPEAFRTISEVSTWLDTPAHVLRFWESRFTQVKPVKRAGGRRYYRPSDMLLLGGIKRLLHEDGLTIRGVQKILREEGVRHVAALSQPLDEADAADLADATDPDIEAPMALDAQAEAAEILPMRRRPAPEPDEAILPGPDSGPPRQQAPSAPTPTPSSPNGAASTEDDEVLAPPPSDAPALDPAPEQTAPEPSAARPPVAQDPTPAGMPAGSRQSPALDEGTPAPETAPDSMPPEAEGLPSGMTEPAEAAPAPAPTAAPPEQPPIPQPLGADLPETDPADDDPAFVPTGLPARSRLLKHGLQRLLDADPDAAGRAAERLARVVLSIETAARD
ncbi:MerR family transcriptional regulator [Rhodovulum sulfidophilum]|uniref:MerR family transcriptional regulator n=1 Tax=Rhodovulum sulfidophilum TaxID=35806 RepID=UPI001EE45C8A|nr:MerR family transcriptional regulator [Rhodovulum sulfidophilum]